MEGYFSIASNKKVAHFLLGIYQGSDFMLGIVQGSEAKGGRGINSGTCEEDLRVLCFFFFSPM